MTAVVKPEGRLFWRNPVSLPLVAGVVISARLPYQVHGGWGGMNEMGIDPGPPLTTTPFPPLYTHTKREVGGRNTDTYTRAHARTHARTHAHTHTHTHTHRRVQKHTHTKREVGGRNTDTHARTHALTHTHTQARAKAYTH